MPLPGSPAYYCNIGAAGDLHSQQDLGRETQITQALWLLHLPMCACVCVKVEECVFGSFYSVGVMSGHLEVLGYVNPV